MAWHEIFSQKKTAIVARWLEELLAAYPQETAAFLRREKDPFANPAGQALQTGIQAIVDSLLEGLNPEKVCHHLEQIIKIRAVQDFAPSEAVRFVFTLKRAVRMALGEAARDPGLRPDLAQLDAQVDQLALFAFDIYARCREQVYDVRVNEVKRNVWQAVEKFNRRAASEQGAGPTP